MNADTQVGTHAWTIRTGGRLQPADTRRLLVDLARAHATNAAGRLTLLVHLHPGRNAYVPPARLVPPNSALTRAATDAATKVLPAVLLNHSHRTYQFGRAIGELEARSGRAPTDEEIAKKLGITEEELEESLSEIARSSIAALDELWTVSGSGGDQVALIDTIEDEDAPDPQGTLSVTEQKEALAEAIQRLPEREKLVVTLYYYEELTLREIGEVLGVTESRVSQLHTKAILRLKARLGGATRVPLG